MANVKNTMIIRRELISRTARMIKEDTLADQIDRLPIEMSPREKGAQRRCCVYKERAITKYKMLPILGFNVHDEVDELTPLSEYVHKAYERETPKTDILTVVDEACTGCVKANYIVTNLCKGCVASPCMMNCPKNAISFTSEGQAKIKPEKCINCGICQKECPYHSIVYMPVPCEEVCPTGAIRKDERGIEVIDDDKCIYCGKCINACPFGSIFEVSNMLDVFKSIGKGEKVIAIAAPSIMGQYKQSTAQVFGAIKELGFYDVYEVAEGAMVTTTNEALELKEKMEEGQPFMTTSCCPAYVQHVEKHLPELAPFVSHTGSPMYYTAEIVKRDHPDAKVVFLGPCVAKRKEAQRDPGVDYIMTFEEVDACLKGFDIDINSATPIELKSCTRYSREFAQSGGVTGAVAAEGVDVEIKDHQINGLNKKSIALLKAAAKGKAPGNFIEVMACEGGCIGGPCGSNDPRKGQRLLNNEINELDQ